MPCEEEKWQMSKLETNLSRLD